MIHLVRTHLITGFGVFIGGCFWSCTGETEMEGKIRDMEMEEERLVVFAVDVFDYQSILLALKGCSAVFCCLENQDGYDVSKQIGFGKGVKHILLIRILFFSLQLT